MSSRGLFAPIALTVLIGMLLSLIPLPAWMAAIRPAFLVLIVVYWSTMAPYSGGIALAFFCGLVLDVTQGNLIGQHALALSFIAFLAVRFHLLVRAKPLFEQCFFVLAALFIYELTLWTIDTWTGQVSPHASRWIYPLTSALLWPVIAGFVGRLHTPH
jgi:rod shape-determining protein MreD